MKEDAKLSLSVDYDPHYCRHFDGASSSWNLEVSDWLKKESGEIKAIKVDGKAIQQSSSGTVIPLPSGSGQHHIEIEF